MVNEDPTEKLIRDLKAENEKLKEMLKNGKIDPSMLEDGHKLSKAEKDAELESMRKQIEQNEKEEEQMKLDYEAKLAAALANKVIYILKLSCCFFKSHLMFFINSVNCCY